MVGMIINDISAQSKSLNSHLTMLKTSEQKQEKIEKELDELWRVSVVELEKAVDEARIERDDLSKKLADLRVKVHQKMNSNDNTIAYNMETEFEVNRLTDFAKQLQDNLENLSVDYQGQFENLIGLMNENNSELDKLRGEHAAATSNLYQIATDNETLAMKLGAMKTERDLHVMRDERHKIEMLKVDTKDAIRRAERMDQAMQHAIASWQNRVSMMQRQVAQMQ